MPAICVELQMLCPIMDARRGQVYAGIYEFDRQKLHDTGRPDGSSDRRTGEKLKSI
ncbi:MAG: hypothetical protein ACLTH6_13145 [Dorea longicatena]